MKKLILLIAFLNITTAFSDSKISEFSEISSIDDADVLPIVDVSAGVTKKVTVGALNTYDAPVQGLPKYVYLNRGNKIEFNLGAEGLLIQSLNSATQTNTAGAFVGGGTGNKAFVEFGKPAYENMLFSNLNTLNFTARNVRDQSASPAGKVYWNIIINTGVGDQPLATEFANVVIDGLPNFFTDYFVLPTTMTTFTSDLAAGRIIQMVGGTGLTTVTGNTLSGSNEVSSVTNINALTVGNYFRKVPAGTGLPETTPIPDGTTIISIDTVNSKVYLSANATLTQTGISLIEYGGMAPVNRSSTATSGNATFPVSNTADLRVGMHVGCSACQNNSAISSIVANTSITLNKTANASGATTLSFIATGKTGVPPNTANVGITKAKFVENNPNAYLISSDPSTWTTTDGGFTKLTKHFPINFCMGDSSTTDTRTNILQSVTINSDVYTFGKN